jgi:beta-glucosidase
VRAERVRVPGAVFTETGWEVYPEGLTRTLCWVAERYGNIPLYVTENGAATADPPQAPANVLEDPMRVEYFRTHLRAAHAAIERGVNLRGYFEWAEGFSKRFGIVHVDYATQRRTPKRSAHFYRDVIRSRGAVLGMTEAANAGREAGE